MTYKEAMAYLAEVGMHGSVLGLDAITELLSRIGSPENRLKFIHIGGTNGKGSTAAYLASILTEAGYKVGRFISPVVEEYEECIQISSRQYENHTRCISKESIASHLTRIQEVCNEMKQEGFAHPTIFEVETVMAMLEFVEKQCDIVILEVGLGGRLDATNVIQNVLCSVIASISMDHMQYLGDTIEKIASEKAGIIKDNTPVVSYPQVKEVREVLEGAAAKSNSPFYEVKKEQAVKICPTMKGSTFYLDSEEDEPYFIPLLGKHQVYNALVAIKVCKVLNGRGYDINREAIRLGLSKSSWFGRLSVVKEHPYVIVDGAHNPDAAEQLSAAVNTYFPGQKGIFVMGVFVDKEYEKILEIMAPFAKTIITVTPDNPRALASSDLQQTAMKYCDEVIDGKTVKAGLTLAVSMAEKSDYILCFGSLSFLGEIHKLIN